MTRGVLALCAAVALVGCAPAPIIVVRNPSSTAPNPVSYGALAYSQSTGNAGSSYNYADRPSAEQAAIANCGATDCAAICWVDRKCAALAVGDDITHWGWGTGQERNNAELHALENCSRLDGNCRIVRWVCSY